MDAPSGPRSSQGRTRVKICGITSRRDLEATIAAGADAIGLNFFAPSPRYITPEAAGELSRQCAPFTNIVALFVNPSRDEVAQVLDEAPRVSVLQFHGEETPEFCASFARPYVKTIGVHEALDLSEAMARYESASAILLDVFDPVRWGGTGRAFDWTQVPAQRRIPVILAGGLNAENVGRAIELVRPYAVDVCGGVESEPGHKDVEKLGEFMRSVRRVGLD